MDPKSLVVQYYSDMFVDHDPTAVDRWIGPGYVQHNVGMRDGPEPLRKMAARSDDTFRYEIYRLIADGDTVALHGSYHAPGREPIVVFEVFRIENDQIVEHWDAFRRYTATASGRTTYDGPTDVTDLDRTDTNRKLVTAFVEDVLIAERTMNVSDFISPSQFHQHNPHMADGIDGFLAGLTDLAARGKKHSYQTVHLVVAEGNFVLTGSAGRRGAAPVAFYDLFRVEAGKIVEHWDAVLRIPDTVPHGNGAF